MTDLAKCTWPEARALFGPRTVAIVPVGATEPHGPHLPLDTDVTIARAQSLRGAELLEAEGVPAVVLPPVCYGITRLAEGFEGRITLRPGTLWALMEDLIESLAEQGIRQVVIASGHLEPEHLRILHGVVLDHAVRARGRAQAIFPDPSRPPRDPALGEEFAAGDCHAGRFESSIALAADPDSVRRELLGELPALRLPLAERLREGARGFAGAGAEQGYCGDPAAASAPEGRVRIERLAQGLVAAARETWPDLFS